MIKHIIYIAALFVCARCHGQEVDSATFDFIKMYARCVLGNVEDVNSLRENDKFLEKVYAFDKETNSYLFDIEMLNRKRLLAAILSKQTGLSAFNINTLAPDSFNAMVSRVGIPVSKSNAELKAIYKIGSYIKSTDEYAVKIVYIKQFNLCYIVSIENVWCLKVGGKILKGILHDMAHTLISAPLLRKRLDYQYLNVILHKKISY